MMSISVLDKIVNSGSAWETERVAEAYRSKRLAWRVAAAAGVLVAILSISLASLAPFRRTVPYLVKVDNSTGNVEVLQAFDNRMIGRQELTDKYWASAYVLARERYNWWMIGGDYDLVNRLTNQDILKDYNVQFEGERALDRVFGELTERRVDVLSVTPAPTVVGQMIVRWQRATTSKGIVVEPPTIFVSTLSFRYVPKTFGAEADLIRNPHGYEVYAYRRDVEQQRAAPFKGGGAEGAASSPVGEATAVVVPAVEAVR